MQAMSGSCLCTACTFTASPVEMEAGACHCGICRKWSGGINMAVHCKDVVWNDDAPLLRYASSDWAERLSCRTCGSNLSYHSLDAPQSEHVISLGAFHEPEKFPVTSEIFIDEKPETFALAGIQKSMTGAEVFAMYAPEGEAT